MIELQSYRPEQASELLTVWHAAMGDRHPIMPSLWTANTEGDPGFVPGDLIVATRERQAVGFVMTKQWRGDYPGCDRFASRGYLALMAVHPAHQRQGIGSALLEEAIALLCSQGAEKVLLEGSFHHFMPGIPASSPEALAFFERRGFSPFKEVWDVRRRLDVGAALPSVEVTLRAQPDIVIRPYAPGEEAALVAFLQESFAGRWARDTDLLLRSGSDVRHVMGVFMDGVPQGFAQLHVPGSPGALRWAGFAPEVAALGPIGMGKTLRGRGLGLALLVRGLEELRAQGARETVIDWTDLLDFYGRCGFTPWLRYTLAQRPLP
ncbi:MAG TPA: GNAT family N-acetyltransferase [Pantanalinema sp.]